MKIKWNWGTGIAVFYTLFAIAVVLFAIFSMGIKFDLTDNDYYEKGLKYQEQMDKIERSGTLATQISTIDSANTIIIKFPKIGNYKVITGMIKFFRPSDATKDLNININLDSNFNQHIPKSKLAAGLYILKIDWQTEGKEYYDERKLAF